MKKIIIIGKIGESKEEKARLDYLADHLRPDLRKFIREEYEVTGSYYKEYKIAAGFISEEIEKNKEAAKKSGENEDKTFIIIDTSDIDKEPSYAIFSVNLVKTLRKERIDVTIISYSLFQPQKQARKVKGAQHFIQKYYLWDIVKCMEGTCNCKQLIKKAKEEKERCQERPVKKRKFRKPYFNN